MMEEADRWGGAGEVNLRKWLRHSPTYKPFFKREPLLIADSFVKHLRTHVVQRK